MAHKSVLLHETIEALQPKFGGTFVDATFGGGGHSGRLAALIGKKGRLIAFDQDASVFSKKCTQEFRALTAFTPVVANFSDIAGVLRRLKVGKIHGAVFDLGLSSIQLEQSGRGFSFQRDEPLLMTFKAKPDNTDVTAEIILNRWSEENISAILSGFGEEHHARSIARAIVSARKKNGRLRSTGELVEVVRRATPLHYQRGRTHFATRTFQALRMATNDELGAIASGVRGVVPFLANGGRLAVISFHSIEDRLVKRTFRDLAETSCCIRQMTKKPITPSADELNNNPRARSAKLRVIEKRKNTI